jgi:hypothetical protein
VEVMREKLQAVLLLLYFLLLKRVKGIKEESRNEEK